MRYNRRIGAGVGFNLSKGPKKSLKASAFNALKPRGESPAEGAAHSVAAPSTLSQTTPHIVVRSVSGPSSEPQEKGHTVARAQETPPQEGTSSFSMASPQQSTAVHTSTPLRHRVRKYAPADRPPIEREDGSGILVSAVLSIHNRSKLFRRALDGYLWQTLPRERWEIVLIDDMSTEDLSQTYSHLLGTINIRHVKVDHTKHPIFRAMNPSWKPGQQANWYHTPCLTNNLGFHLARGSILCLCHPEVLHAPENFERAASRLRRQNSFLFGSTYIGTPEANARLTAKPDWRRNGWQAFLDSVNAGSMKRLDTEYYWYTSFLPKDAAIAVGGCDFAYMSGAGGEDDDFRDRVALAGWRPSHAGDIEGFHQNHDDEKERHRRRDTPEWAQGLARNRKIYSSRLMSGAFPFPANDGSDWTCRDIVVSVKEFVIGNASPVS